MTPIRALVIIAIAFGLAACNPFAGDPGAAAEAGSLTGAQATAKLNAKGWQWMAQPNVVAKGNATTTTLMTAPPKTMTIMIMEYNPAFAGAAFNAMKGNDPNSCQLFGSTIVQITGGTPEMRAKAMSDIASP
jgi:hypothetical protein